MSILDDDQTDDSGIEEGVFLWPLASLVVIALVALTVALWN